MNSFITDKPPLSSPEQELPPHSVVIVDVANISPQERDIWRQKGIKFLIELSDESHLSRFGTEKPTTLEGYNQAVDKFLENDKGPHFMANVVDDNSGDLLASTSMFDYSHYAPHCIEISYTALVKGKGLGTEMLSSVKPFLADNGYSHVYGYFEELGANKHVFEKVFGEPTAGTHKDGYYWRTTDSLTADQRYTDAAITTYFDNLTTLNVSDQEGLNDEQRRKFKDKAIKKLYKFYKKLSIKPENPQEITFTPRSSS
jgi:RimJ/RimL family protein N-acetyltransferase